MTKWRTAILGALILAFAAGIPVGWMFDPFDPPMEEERYDPSWLHSELDLSETQIEQMRDVWTRAAENHRNYDRDQFARDKDDVIRGLLTDEQVDQYNKIEAEFSQQRDQINQEKKARHRAALEETMAILSDEQRSKFEELLEAQQRIGELPMLNRRPGRGKEER